MISYRSNHIPRKQSHPTEDLVNNARKLLSTSIDSVPNTPNIGTGANNTNPSARKSAKLNRSATAGGGTADTSQQSPLTPHNNTASSAPGSAAAAGSANASSSAAAAAKQKRGRKLKMSAEKPSSGPAASSPVRIGSPLNAAAAASTPLASGGTATSAAAAAAAAAAATAAQQKKKRGRKTVPENQNQTPTAASTSDEEEECSATNCVRPAGKLIKHTMRVLHDANPFMLIRSAQAAKSTGCNATAAATNGTTCTASVW